MGLCYGQYIYNPCSSAMCSELSCRGSARCVCRVTWQCRWANVVSCRGGRALLWRLLFAVGFKGAITALTVYTFRIKRATERTAQIPVQPVCASWRTATAEKPTSKPHQIDLTKWITGALGAGLDRKTSLYLRFFFFELSHILLGSYEGSVSFSWPEHLDCGGIAAQALKTDSRFSVSVTAGGISCIYLPFWCVLLQTVLSCLFLHFGGKRWTL